MKGGVMMKTVIKENRKSGSNLNSAVSLTDSKMGIVNVGDDFIIFMMGIYLNKKLVVLRLPADVPGMLVKALDMHDKMTANALLFDEPNPSMPDFLKHINAALAAEAAMEDPDTEKTNTRDKTAAVVIIDCGTERDYVQSKVNLDLPNADSIVLDAGMGLKGYTSPGKQVWALYYTGLTGEVECQGGIRSYRSAYEWQFTYTPDDEASWWSSRVNPTLQATTKLTHLSPGKMVYVRFRHILKDGPDDWSIVLSIMVV
jgi:hypothetical protein